MGRWKLQTPPLDTILRDWAEVDSQLVRGVTSASQLERLGGAAADCRARGFTTRNSAELPVWAAQGLQDCSVSSCPGPIGRPRPNCLTVNVRRFHEEKKTRSKQAGETC